jgi:hypothetical protein
MGNQQDHTKKFSAADIERYHNGTMPATEMHLLEKAALEDPFLADAVEGYKFTQTPAQDLDELREHLHKRTKGRKLMVSVQEQKTDYRLLKVAALFILLAGCSWLVYQLTEVRKNDLAINKDEVKTPANTSDSTFLSSPSTTQKEIKNSDETLTEKESDNLQRKPTMAEAKKPIPPTSDLTTNVNKDHPEVTTMPVTADSFSSAKKESEARSPANTFSQDRAPMAAQNKNVFKGRIVDTGNTGVPFATVTDKKNGQTLQSDANGAFSLRAPDSSVTVVINSVGFEGKNSVLKDTSEQKIVLQPSNNSLNEAVATGNGTQKRKTSNQPLNRNARFIVEEAEPENGWKYFDDYVTQNLKSPEELNIKTIRGEVKLSFNVNERGEPVNIKVEKSLCAQCDAEAIRILKEGPKWKKAKKDKATIRF